MQDTSFAERLNVVYLNSIHGLRTTIITYVLLFTFLWLLEENWFYIPTSYMGIEGSGVFVVHVHPELRAVIASYHTPLNHGSSTGSARWGLLRFLCAEKVKCIHYCMVQNHLNFLRSWWHIDPRDLPAPQSLPHNHDLHVRHSRKASPGPSLSSSRSVHGVTRVVPAPKGIKTRK
jgi:hypothetical protein